MMSISAKVFIRIRARSILLKEILNQAILSMSTISGSDLSAVGILIPGLRLLSGF